MNNSDRKIVKEKEQNKSFLESNQQTFTELLTFVDFVDEKLNIGFVEVNFAQDRDVLIEALINHQDCQDIQFEVLNFPAPDLRFLRDELVAALEKIELASDKKLVLLITGLEKSIGVLEEYPAILTNLNFVRDDLRYTVCHPIILFLPEYALTRLAKYAPDFWAWGRKVFYFKAKQSIQNKFHDTTIYGRVFNSLGLLEKQERIDLLLRLLSEYRSSSNQKKQHNSLNIINIYNQLGIAYETLGEFQKAIYYHQKSLNIAQQIGNMKEIAESLQGLGNSYNYLGQRQKASDYIQRSLDIFRKIGDRNGEANSLKSLGNVYVFLEKYQQAFNYYRKSLDIFQKIGDQHGIGNCFGDLGIVYYSLGEYQNAISYYKKSLNIAQSIGDCDGEANSLNNLGYAYHSLGEYQKAINFSQKSLDIFQQIGDHYREAASLDNLGHAYHSLGDYQKSIDFYKQSLAILQKIGDRHGEAISWFHLGNTLKNLQQNSEAKAAYDHARKLYQAIRLDKKVEDCNKAIQDLEIG